MVPMFTSKRDAAKQDAVLLAAIDLARAALEEVAEPGTVGAHSGMQMLGERLAISLGVLEAPGTYLDRAFPRLRPT